MPENYYSLDNFFSKMTDLESPRKNNDCYFYYYSTCTKGDNCTFRHEPSALGCETTCSFWKEGKCINVHCNFRHMELRKNRKSIPCYWESQPGGCKKPHCPFLHSSPKVMADDGETSDLKSSADSKDSDICNKKVNQVENDFVPSPVVDPLVVNFEEESDNESAPTQSPIKTQRVVKVKTLEEIKLERIQAESAAYYSYPNSGDLFELEDAEFLRNRIIKRMTTKKEKPDLQNVEVLSLDEIRKRRMKNQSFEEPIAKKQKVSLGRIKSSDLTEIKIKTLEEIKADRLKRFGSQIKRKLEDELEKKECKVQKIEHEVSSSESEVSSTSKIEMGCDVNSENVEGVVSPLQLSQEDSVNISGSINEKVILSTGTNKLCVNEDDIFESSKLDDLLLEDDDFDNNSISLKAEEDILKDIDSLLNE